MKEEKKLVVAVSGPRDLGALNKGSVARAFTRAFEELAPGLVKVGGAEGVDTIALEAALALGLQVEVYLPWNGFRGMRRGIAGGALVLAPEDWTRGDEEAIASSVHPAWDRLPGAVRALMARNVAVTRGASVLLYVPPREERGGGTAHALAVARLLGVPSRAVL